MKNVEAALFFSVEDLPEKGQKGPEDSSFYCTTPSGLRPSAADLGSEALDVRQGPGLPVLAGVCREVEILAPAH